MELADYDRLVRQVDQVTGAIEARRHRDLACRLGCTLCCHVELSLCAVEAAAVRRALARLDPEARQRVRLRARERLAAAAPPPLAACVCLEPDGACAIYDARPVVCRTHGHALRHPKGEVAREAVYAEAENSDITWCPLNYVGGKPRSEDVLDMERVNSVLASTNRAHVSASAGSTAEAAAGGTRVDPAALLARESMTAIAAE